MINLKILELLNWTKNNFSWWKRAEVDQWECPVKYIKILNLISLDKRDSNKNDKRVWQHNLLPTYFIALNINSRIHVMLLYGISVIESLKLWLIIDGLYVACTFRVHSLTDILLRSIFPISYQMFL